MPVTSKPPIQPPLIQDWVTLQVPKFRAWLSSYLKACRNLVAVPSMGLETPAPWTEADLLPLKLFCSPGWRFLHRERHKSVLLSTHKLYRVLWLEHSPGCLPLIPKLLRRYKDKQAGGMKSAWVSGKTLVNPTIFLNWGPLSLEAPRSLLRVGLVLVVFPDDMQKTIPTNTILWCFELCSDYWINGFPQNLSPFSFPHFIPRVTEGYLWSKKPRVYRNACKALKQPCNLNNFYFYFKPKITASWLSTFLY